MLTKNYHFIFIAIDNSAWMLYSLSQTLHCVNYFYLYQKNKLNIIIRLLYLVLNMLAISSELLNRLVFHVKCKKFPCRFVGTFHAFYIKYNLYFQQSQAMSMLSPFPPQLLQLGEYYAVDYVQNYYFGGVLDTSDGFV